MSISVPIDQLINENIVEWARIEFKEEWDPNSTLKTISAFANNIDNWGNGYIVFFRAFVNRNGYQYFRDNLPWPRQGNSSR